jgi:O-methyltransferase
MARLRSRLRARLLRALNAPSGTAQPRTDDFDGEFCGLVERVKPYTMTSSERLYGLQESCQYVLREAVPGDFVECGVWRGGSSMVMALALADSDASRRLWLYDTFEGMTEPDQRDGELAAEHWRRHLTTGEPIAYSPLDEVKRNLGTTGLAEHRIRFVVGKVESTIPNEAPDRIALLRLDTDWYGSTRHELDHLWRRISPGGVLIIDDYGHFDGARRATDEFFRDLGRRPLFSRLDYTGRLIVKPD